MSKHKKVVVTVDWKKLLPILVVVSTLEAIIICIGISLAIVLVVTLI